MVEAQVREARGGEQITRGLIGHVDGMAFTQSETGEQGRMRAET